MVEFHLIKQSMVSLLLRKGTIWVKNNRILKFEREKKSDKHVLGR
jgi:hypothetical protein